MELSIISNFLAKKIFFTETKWPQFNLLLEDLEFLSLNISDNQKVLSLERNHLYAGRSLVAPFFSHVHLDVCEMSDDKNKLRGAYNSYLFESMNTDIDKTFFKYKAIDQLAMAEIKYDLILIPNYIHHCTDVGKLMLLCKSILSDSGSIYVFDSTLREWHQIPNDYFRLTPFAFEILAKQLNMKVQNIKTTGGPFTSIWYFVEQAKEYLSSEDQISKEFMDWVDGFSLQQMNILDEQCPKNIHRSSSSSPTAYSLFVSKC